jgi:hypothetical protein
MNSEREKPDKFSNKDFIKYLPRTALIAILVGSLGGLVAFKCHPPATSYDRHFLPNDQIPPVFPNQKTF